MCFWSVWPMFYFQDEWYVGPADGSVGGDTTLHDYLCNLNRSIYIYVTVGRACHHYTTEWIGTRQQNDDFWLSSMVWQPTYGARNNATVVSRRGWSIEMSYTTHRWRELGVLGQRVRLYSVYWAESEGGRCCFCGYPVTIFKSGFWDRSLKVWSATVPISSLMSSATVRYPSRMLLLCIDRDTIFLRYCIVMPLWFISAWLTSCVLCCKSVGAQLFYDGANDAGFFFILTFSSAGRVLY